MYKVVDHKGNQMKADNSFKVCAGYAKNVKKPFPKEYIYVTDENDNKILKF